MKAIQILNCIDEKILLHDSVASIEIDGKSYNVQKVRRVAKTDARKILALADFLEISERAKDRLNYIINTF
jgi:hypothetical protein